jgi:carbonic anhydrase/acetyltransferase-like protein (isoleucine patch superfamily)
MKKMFTKFMFVMCLSAFTFSAHALEVKGVKVDESVQVGVNTLVLNGAGVRTKMMFKVYVAALYLGQKQTDATVVIGDHGSKRVALHFLREVSSEKLLHGMDEGFSENNSANEMTSIESQMKAFHQMMASAKEVKEGDVILLDYIPNSTQVSLNGKVLGKIEGEVFNQALLRVWLGTHAVDASLKKEMLGQ